MSRPLRLGTRGSRLARWQAEWVAAKLAALPDAPPVEIVEIETSGDRIQDRMLSQVGGQAFFTAEIQQAVLDERVDFAVHSLKDLATRPPRGLELGAVLERADPRDALLTRDGRGLAELSPGARVGTSSLRRIAFLAVARPDIESVELRGNVPTRVRRLDEGGYDAIVLATAGLERLGMGERISERMAPETFTPAPAQGAVAVELRVNDPEVSDWIGRIDHAPTHTATRAERTLMRILEGGCSVPIGALATIEGDRIRMLARVASLDGRRNVHDSLEGDATRPDEVGRALAERLRAAGADEILAGIRAGSAEG